MTPHPTAPTPLAPPHGAPLPGAVPPDADLREVLAGLRHVGGAVQQRALLLALLHTPGSAAEQRAWQAETAELPAPVRVRIWALADELPDAARLPVLEDLLRQARPLARAERVEWLRAARRLMCADGRVSALDRLRWLLLRHRLASAPGAARPRDGAPADGAQDALADLPLAPRQAIADVTAFLARLVPQPDAVAKVGAEGAAWYRAVLRMYWFDAPPPCHVPDGDRLVRALAQVQALTWAQRPVLARLWVQAALKVNRRRHDDPTLGAVAAQALRLASGLLDAPLHEAVAARFVALDPAPPAGAAAPPRLAG